jgi:hypothetical protein
MSDNREIEQSVQVVGIDERPIWGVNVSNWGNSPSSVVLVCYKYVVLNNSWSDVTSSCFPSGTSSVLGNTITFPVFVPQAVGDNYRIEFKFTITGGSILEGYAYIDCE